MLGPQDLWIGLALGVFFFGAKKLPELSRSIGQAMSEFRKGVTTGAPEEPLRSLERRHHLLGHDLQGPLRLSRRKHPARIELGRDAAQVQLLAQGRQAIDQAGRAPEGHPLVQDLVV